MRRFGDGYSPFACKSKASNLTLAITCLFFFKELLLLNRARRLSIAWPSAGNFILR